jgi:transcriptional regulator with XRE-family HTH domain
MSNGLSLRELGRRTGVTASLLSQIENGKSDPSVSTLSALVAELGLSLDALLRSEWGVPDAGPAEPRRSAVIPLAEKREDSPVMRPPERQTLDLDSGVVWERLTRGPSELMDALLVTYEPGATSSSSGKLLRHNGTEHAYLISGELTLQLGFETYHLRAGDSLQFDGATPHVYCNQGDVPARGLWFVVGRDSLPVQPGPHRLLDRADLEGEGGLQGMLTAVDFLEAFSRD